MGQTTADRIAHATARQDTDPWPFHAACADTPQLMDATRPPLVHQALALCATCPVIQQCRTWAEDETDYVGVAGGALYTSRHSHRRSTTHTLQTAS